MMETQGGDRLVNEAIKRILLDIVIRGHGDRLIGRWSREPELQQFLEQVPYMLDRINQLHLACARSEALDTRHLHHHHHHHHHHNHHHHRDEHLNGSSVNDFIGLIAPDMHWLVRTRDTMGLTPLHKAVLHCNRPIVEYIVDRYQGELAACSWRPQLVRSGQHQPRQQTQPQPMQRLLDAEDKYGRTALHYAAARLADTKHRHRQHNATIIYQLLLDKGASPDVRDFRGATPAYYVRHPKQLRAESIVHLANKLNANFQANVLSKTLRASTSQAPIRAPFDASDTAMTRNVRDHLSGDQLEQFVAEMPQNGHLSTSCHDLRRRSNRDEDDNDDDNCRKLLPEVSANHQTAELSVNCHHLAKRSKSSLGNNTAQVTMADTHHLFKDGRETGCDGRQQSEVSPPPSQASSEQGSLEEEEAERALKWLLGERCQRQILDQRAKQSVRRCLSEGVVSKITELLVDGYGSFIMDEAATTCWNQQCKRYIRNVMPNLLEKLDRLHELIALDRFQAFKSLLQEEPMLVRMRRPYRRASLNALHLAVQLDRRRQVKFLLHRYPELVAQLDSQGATCLHWAAKSLALERLYFWLCEQPFARQLELVEDSRGKLPADYRQQALKVAQSRNRPSIRASDKAPEQLLKRNQEASNKLQFVGTKCALTNRRQPKQTAMVAPDNEPTSSASESNSEPLDKSIEIGLDELSSMQTMGEDEQEEAPDNDKQDPSAVSVAQPVAEFGAAEDEQSSNSGSGRQEREMQQLHRQRRRSTVCKHDPTVTSHTSGSGQQLTRSSDANGDDSRDENLLSQTLLGEMVQLDSGELEASETRELEPATTIPIDSAPGTGELGGESRSVQSGKSELSQARPTSASRLNRIIWDSILNDDFKKLEHLILAGCGQRLLDVYNSASEGATLSDEMRNFFKTKVPQYIDSTLQVHRVLHTCYAIGSPGLAEPTTSAFHKLCSLLSRSSLIMCRDSFGATSLHVGLMRCDKRLVDFLVRRQPEVASAPDHQNRNSLHYAALALAAHRHHGKFTLTCGSNVGGGAGGYWIVDETSERLYEKLSSRYSELLEAKDKRGLTCTDYLEAAHEAGQALDNCCPDYAKLLARYSYVIVANEDNEEEEAGPATSGSPRGKKERPVRRSGSCGETAEANLGQTLQPAKRKGAGASGASAQRSHTADELLKQLDGELLVPATYLPLEAAFVRQVAPKPTVGCNTGFQHMPLSPTSLEPSKLDGFRAHSAQQQGGQKSGGSNSNNKAVVRHRPWLDDLDPNQQPSPAPAHHHHHRRRHHHHHHRRHSRARRSPSQAFHQSVVGGVIVPTIIHNDKMDEIETYDIIYRPPPPVAAGQASSASSFSTSSSSDEEGAPSRSASRAGSRKSVGRARSADSSSGSSMNLEGEEEEEDYDERVERLSSEFESRVRREKSELRAKVDQIMNEIKMSSKSEKSTRFLSSPINGAPDKEPAGPSNASTINCVTTAGPRSSIGSYSTASGATTNSGSSSGNSSGGAGARTASSAASSRSCSSSTTSFSSALASEHSASQAKRKSSPVPATAAPDRTKSEVAPSAGGEQQQQQQVKKMPNLGLEQVSQVLSKNAYGQTYLHFIASRSQNPSVLYKVLAHGSHLIGERDIFYRTARDVAVQFNLPNNVQILDKFIIDLFIEAKTGLLRHLLNQGYSPLIHVGDPDGNDIMLILKLLKLDRMIHFLLQMADFQRWRDELHTFIRHGYSAGVSELIKRHPDLVQAKSVHARTSLHLAALFDRLDMVVELLEADPASVHATDNMGRTPLHYIYGLTLQNMEEIRDRMLGCGASFEARDAKMRTPKYYFIFKREIEEIKRIELELN